MARVSNVVITILNLLTLVVSLFVVVYATFLYAKVETPCERWVRLPLGAVGVALMVVSLAGLMGACCCVAVFMWLYLIMLFVLILGLTALTLFAVVVTQRGWSGGDPVVGDYSKWLQSYVMDEGRWGRIRMCLTQAEFCGGIENGKGENYYKHDLPLFKSGCCKPPNYCGMVSKNATTWVIPAQGPTSPDPDCKAWSNNQTQLCFDCMSCKEAAMGSIRREWRTLAVANTCICLCLSIVYNIGCCALRNNQRHGYTKHRHGYDKYHA